MSSPYVCFAEVTAGLILNEWEEFASAGVGFYTNRNNLRDAAAASNSWLPMGTPTLLQEACVYSALLLSPV